MVPFRCCLGTLGSYAFPQYKPARPAYWFYWWIYRLRKNPLSYENTGGISFCIPNKALVGDVELLHIAHEQTKYRSYCRLHLGVVSQTDNLLSWWNQGFESVSNFNIYRTLNCWDSIAFHMGIALWFIVERLSARHLILQYSLVTRCMYVSHCIGMQL